MPDAPLRLVLFDFDGTVCDSATTIIRLFKQACRLCALPEPEDSFIRGNIGHGLSHAALRYANNDPSKATQLAETYGKLACGEYQGDKPPLDPLFDGVSEALSKLRAQDYLVGIITNKSRVGLDSLVVRHGLDKLIDISVCADDCVVKPAPDMAILAMRQTGVETKNTVLVGDTEIDAGCAANAGISFIGVSWGYHAPDRLIGMGAVHILASYDELGDVLERQFSC